MESCRKPAGWREYIKGSFAVLGQTRWIWREFMSPKTRRQFIWTLLAVVLGSLLGVLWPYLFKFVIDGVQGGAVMPVAIALAVIWVFNLINHRWELTTDKLGERLGSEQVVDLETRMTELFFGKSLGQHLGDSQELSPANVKKGQKAVRALEKIMLYQLFPVLGRAVVLFVLLTWLHWVTGLVALAMVAYTMVWSLHLNRRVMVEGEEIDKEYRAVDRYMDERWRNVERVKAFGKEAEERDCHLEMNRAAKERSIRFWQRYHFLSYIRSQTSSAPFFIGVMAVAAWMVMSGGWTVGMMIPFIFWSNNFTFSINELRRVERQINGQLPAIQTLKRLMELEPAVKDPSHPKDFAPDGPVSVTMIDVGFSYPGKDPSAGDAQGKRKEPKQVLKDVWVRAKAGQKIAIIGPSGAGKTTLLHMLLRSRDPDKGIVMFDGIDLREISQSVFKRFIGYAPQGAPLFDGTIRELMLYGLAPEDRKSVTDDDIWELLRTVRADFGDRLDSGLDTKIGRDGIELSGGERQRLSAAMALMNPRLRLLVMDEPTSNLDAETQQGFQDGLKAVLARGVTTFIVAHRLSTVRDCDQFIVLKSVSGLAEGESQVEAVAESFEGLYDVSSTFRRVARNEGLTFGPRIGVNLKDVPLPKTPLFGNKPIDLNA
ncbi:MAG: ABC transporter ATP-binding protein [Patescibacteria group bacterium]|nr:ABC transporter ATP-binding protein [Patescibacteria group bacterium]